MSGAAIATSFLGGAAFEHGTSVWAWLAVAFFVLLGAAVLAILWPRHDWEYAVRPELLIENYIEHPEPLELPLIHRDLALHMDNAYLSNRGQLLRLVRFFRWASALLTLEVLSWVVDLALNT
jgi:hypothetical protein